MSFISYYCRTFITSRSYKQYEGSINVKSVSSRISESISKGCDNGTHASDCGPYVDTSVIHYIQRDSVYIVSGSRSKEEGKSLLILSLLEHAYAMLRRYFGAPLSESVLRVNFDTLYLLLDEVFVGGLPFSLELNNLESTVVTPSASSGLVNKLASAVSALPRSNTNSLTGLSAEISWRRPGVVHASNEFYLDIIDRVNCIVDTTGKVISGSISGRIDANCKLSGIPEILMSFKTPSLFQSANISFHPCVRLPRWKRDAKLSFVPPDGTFTLAEYCIFTDAVLPLHVNIDTHDLSQISISVSPRLNVTETAQDVSLVVRVPTSVTGATLVTDVGSARFADQCIHWKIGKLGGPVKLEGSLAGDHTGCDFRISASAEFLVRGWAASGIKVDCVEISGIDYTPYKGCRYSTGAGRVDLRI